MALKELAKSLSSVMRLGGINPAAEMSPSPTAETAVAVRRIGLAMARLASTAIISANKIMPTPAQAAVIRRSRYRPTSAASNHTPMVQGALP